MPLDSSRILLNSTAMAEASPGCEDLGLSNHETKSNGIDELYIGNASASDNENVHTDKCIAVDEPFQVFPESVASHKSQVLDDNCSTVTSIEVVNGDDLVDSDSDSKSSVLLFEESLCSEQLTGLSLSKIPENNYTLRKKQIFVLSEAGKPVYCRYGNEDDLVTIFGVMQALVAFVQNGDDMLHSIMAGNVKYVFYNKPPVILVAVSNGWESKVQLHQHLVYVHYVIISMLTSSQMKKIFEKRRNYDLRRLIGDGGRLIDSLLNFMDRDPSILLGAVRCLPMASTSRETIAQAVIQSCNKIPDLIFAILIAENQLISLVRMKKCFLHTVDLHLIMNLVNSSLSFKSVESWSPICLPKFNSSGYLHGHVSYLSEDCQACLLLLSIDRDAFFALSSAKQRIVERLRRQNILSVINEALETSRYFPRDVEIPEIRHFLYKSSSNSQFTSPEIDVPYHTDEERALLMGKYLTLHNRIHSSSCPLKTIYQTTNSDNIFGWVTPTFELYAAFEPLVTKSDAINAINKLIEWIKKKETKFFILNDPTF